MSAADKKIDLSSRSPPAELLANESRSPIGLLIAAKDTSQQMSLLREHDHSVEHRKRQEDLTSSQESLSFFLGFLTSNEDIYVQQQLDVVPIIKQISGVLTGFKSKKKTKFLHTFGIF